MYKLFLDDSGQKEYLNEYNSLYIDNPPDDIDYWRKNYFCLAGVYIKTSYIKELDLKIKEIKIKYFKTHKFEIKSTWLRDSKQRKKNYIDPFWISDEDLNNFWKEIIDFIWLNKDKIKILWVIFDKRFYKNRDRNEAIPLLKTTQVIFEKVEYIWNNCEIVFDQMEKSLKIKKWNNHHKILLVKENHLMEKVFIDEYKKIKNIEFQKSCNDNFLQLADLCAYNIYRQFIMYSRDWEKWDIKMYEYFEKIAWNIHNVNNKIMWKWLIIIPNINIWNPI